MSAATLFPRPADVEASTPPGRDRAIDVIRITALLAVVIGHTVMATSIIRDDVFIWSNLLTGSPVFQALTWVFQIMPLFFFAGVGNAYSDEVLHVAKLSPFAMTTALTPEQVHTLYEALRTTLTDAVAAASGKPAKELKDAKRAGMRVHGRTGEACPVCGDVVREVSFADRSLQYCATCQTGGKPLADRRMSKLLK